jgi:hypothetical protein
LTWIKEEIEKMKKQLVLTFILLALLILPWVSTVPVQAAASTTAFTALDATCSITPGVQWVSGNVLHVRNEIDTKQTASSNSLVNGMNTVTTNYDINLITGSGGGWGTFILQPDQVNGAWMGSFSGPLSYGVFSGQGVAGGTGALEGMKLSASFQGISVPSNQPCAPAQAYDADQIQGTITSLP